MSTRARKSGNRIANLRARAHNSLAAWDDTMLLDSNSVFVPAVDVEAILERLEQRIEQCRLAKLDHQFLDGGVLVRFRRKRDADIFRQALLE
jgi:hypothetical protein